MKHLLCVHVCVCILRKHIFRKLTLYNDQHFKEEFTLQNNLLLNCIFNCGIHICILSYCIMNTLI